MSKNIVDVVIELQSENLGLLPSRRQIDYNGGYVNNWNTQTFSEYVKKYSDLIIERDHSGAEQGILNNDEYISLDIDSNYIEIRMAQNKTSLILNNLVELRLPLDQSSWLKIT
jgi:hypothetical protein